MNTTESTGAQLINVERMRQIAKGYDAKHDDGLAFCSLRQAARAYHIEPGERVTFMENGTPRPWPWVAEKWKPSPADRVRELTRAGALYLADSDRCLRAKDLDAVRVLRSKAAQCASAIDRLAPAPATP